MCASPILQDEWVGLTLDDVRRLEAEAAVYLQHVMKADEADGTTDASGSQLPTAQATTTDTDEEEERAGASSSSDIFFDCVDAFNVSPVRSQKPSLIRWSSELLVNDASGPDAAARIDESPPPTPRRLNKSSLLILVFHGDAQCEVSFVEMRIPPPHIAPVAAQFRFQELSLQHAHVARHARRAHRHTL